MLKVRTTKTSSGNTAVQVVYRHNHKTEIVKHIGTARSEKERRKLLELADLYIASNKRMPPLLPHAFAKEDQDNFVVSLKHLKAGSYYYHFAYEFLSSFYVLNGFDKIQNNLLKDLAFMRIIEPCSKLHSVELLKEYFAIKYPINNVYEGLRKIRLLKDSTEKIAVLYTKKHLSFDFSLVFYDVTTLYFETFKDDEFRKPGFSKDNKSAQPQILVGLMVTREGYPVAVDLFEGNTFEGKTMIPSILRFKEKYQIGNLTVVADAAMLSFKNMEELQKHNLQYIVGARLGNLSEELIRDISTSINKAENIFVKRQTKRGILICDYTKKRAAKDKYDREKAIRKAERQIEEGNPILKRIPFLKETTKTVYTLNHKLIEKDEMLEGLKGYYTNIENMDNQLIVSRYKDLWHVEKSFRITKSDLEARPIFHHKRESIEAHIIIVFVSLCLAKSIEIFSGLSIKKVRDSMWRILDIELIDTLTDRKFIKRMETTENVSAEILEKLRTVDNSSKRVLKK